MCPELGGSHFQQVRAPATSAATMGSRMGIIGPSPRRRIRSPDSYFTTDTTWSNEIFVHVFCRDAQRGLNNGHPSPASGLSEFRLWIRLTLRGRINRRQLSLNSTSPWSCDRWHTTFTKCLFKERSGTVFKFSKKRKKPSSA